MNGIICQYKSSSWFFIKTMYMRTLFLYLIMEIIMLIRKLTTTTTIVVTDCIFFFWVLLATREVANLNNNTSRFTQQMDKIIQILQKI